MPSIIINHPGPIELTYNNGDVKRIKSRNITKTINEHVKWCDRHPPLKVVSVEVF